MMYNIYIRSTVKRAVKLINSRREKTMKRITALILGALMLCTVFASCTGKSSDDLADKDPGKPAVSGNDTAANTDDNTGDASSDLAYITGKKKLVIGITEYKPMNYQEDGEWTGFDTEFAKAFCEKLGVEAEFLPIHGAQVQGNRLHLERNDHQRRRNEKHRRIKGICKERSSRCNEGRQGR